MRCWISIMTLSLMSSVVEGQDAPATDSPVARFLELGPTSDWQPNVIFADCADLAGWRELVFTQLASVTGMTMRRAARLSCGLAVVVMETYPELPLQCEILDLCQRPRSMWVL